MTGKKKPTTAPQGQNEQQEPATDRRQIELELVTAGGDPLPIDPGTGEIDVDKLTDRQRAALEKSAQQLTASLNKFLPKLSPAMQAAQDNITRLSNAMNSAGVLDKLLGIIRSIAPLTDTERGNAEQILDGLRALREILQPATDLSNEIDELEPYIRAELEKGDYGGLTFDEMMTKYELKDMIELRNAPDSIIYRLFEAAAAAKAADLPIIDISRAERLKTPVDRFNFLAFDDFKETGGQIKFNMMSESDKRHPERSKLNISMRYALTFGDDPNIKTSKELNHFDRRLQQAIDSLYVPNGQNIFLIGDISETMGGSRNPSENRREKINASLTKQGTARIFIDNAKEATEYNYPPIKYDGIILDFERIRVTYNGQEVTAIKVNSRPVMMDFADQRDQMSAVPIEVIQSGIKQTDRSLRIDDYLLYRIIRQKRTINQLQEQQQKGYTQSRQKKIREASKLVIMLDTFHEQAGTAGKKKIVRDRAEETARKYLDHYEKTGYIVSYTTDDKRIKIELPVG